MTKWLTLAVLSLSPGWAQSFTADSRTTTPTPVTPVKPNLGAEARGDICMARKDYRTAIDLYQSIQPPTAAVINKVGIAYHQMMELGTAVRYYQQAAKMKPDYPEAVNNLGTVFYATKHYRRAVKQYERALKLAPNSASIHSNLGTAWFARKNYKKAMESYQKALELDPEVFEHKSTHGVLLQERSVAERAKFHFYLAKTYAKAGQSERALMYMRKCLEEGFRERQKFVSEPEFAMLQQLPEFQELMQLQPRVL
jgi:tetratricopeptide (TPR) repeat protein